MRTSLRAFLMLRHVSGEWEIEVHHDLEGVVASWVRRSESVTAAVLHVGFERRVAKSFEGLARDYPDRVLLTSGAKGALPRAFGSSVREVSVVADEPIYLALEGWGYSENEPGGPAGSLDPANFAGWVDSFARENPDETSTLLEHGILDEESYLDREAQLDRGLRTSLGIYRSRVMVGAVSDDPSAIARAAPPWLAERALDSLGLTVRIGNVFRNRHIVTVSDLQPLTISDLRTFQNFGRTSIHHLVGILRRALLAGPVELESSIDEPISGTLLDSVSASLQRCNDRERDILTRRMGLECEAETLQEIGESYGVTRERIRQIEDKTVARLIREEVWDDILSLKLRKILTGREFPLPLVGAEALDPWFTGLGSQRNAAHYLIANMCTTGAALAEIDGIEYLGFLSQEAWQDALRTARRLLSSGVEARWPKRDCEHYVAGLLSDDCPEFAGLLWDNASAWCHFTVDGPGEVLAAYGRGAEQIVEAVLQDSDAPLHYSDIRIRASKRGSRDIDERRAHNAAAEVGYLFGPGTYGLLKHLSVTREEREALADEAAEIVSDGPPDRQWHTSEILEHLRTRGVSFPDTFNKYELDIALKQQGLLSSLGRMVWASPFGAAEGVRVEIRQAVIALLQQAGRPLSSSELRQRLIAVRGINQGIQFAPQDPVIKLDSRTWALNDRDISIKRCDQAAFLDEVAAKLSAKGSSIHFSEFSAMFGDQLPPRTVLCLTASDPRFQVIPGAFLALSDWASANQGGSVASAA